MEALWLGCGAHSMKVIEMYTILGNRKKYRCTSLYGWGSGFTDITVNMAL